MNPYLILAVCIVAPLAAYRVLRNRRRAGLAFVAGVIAATGVVSVAQVASAEGNTNSPEYWEEVLGDGSDCFKNERYDRTPHGSITDDGKSVTLVTFNPDGTWEQDFWRLLVVDGGNGETVIEYPSAGVAYFPPLNGGGQQPDISHYIVCKGYDDEPVETTTTIEATTTTTAATTTIAGTTTSTGAQPTTTEAASNTTAPPSSQPPVTTAARPNPTPGAEVLTDLAVATTGVTGAGMLPATGQDNTGLLAAAGALLAIGTTLVLVRRRPA